MTLAKEVYEGLKKGARPNIVEEEDYIPSEPDPDIWVTYQDFEEDKLNENP